MYFVLKLVIILSVSYAADCTSVLNDNKCSKFDYEYRVLERIIFLENTNADIERKQMILERKNEELREIVKEQRLEMERLNKDQDVKREKLKTTVENNTSEMKERQSNIEKEVESVKRAIVIQGDTIQQQEQAIQRQGQKLHQQDEKFQQLDTDHARDMENITTSLLNLKTEMSEKNDRQTRNVSFSATLDVDYIVSNGDTILFKGVSNNDGDAYNALTGIFTAPVAGKYWFTTTITIHPGTYTFVQIMRNNVEIARLHSDATDSTTRDTGSVSTVMNLRQGDIVYCSWKDGSTSESYNIHGINVNVFSGVLLSEF